jgi:hypothetical protein
MFNSLAALSALALVTLLLVTTTNGSALHIGGSRIWIELHELSWQVDIPDGSGRRTILALFSPLVFIFLTCFPTAWALQKWRSHERRTSQPRLPLLQFLLLLLLITWLPLISMLYGPDRIGEKSIELFFIFVVFFFAFVPLWLLLRFARFLGAAPARRRQQRIDTGLCAECGYSLTGNVSGKCPECGALAIKKAAT